MSQIPQDDQRLPASPAVHLSTPNDRIAPISSSFVGDGIEQAANSLVQPKYLARNPIQRIGDAGDDEQQQGGAVAFLPIAPIKERRDQQNAQASDEIGNMTGFEKQGRHGVSVCLIILVYSNRPQPRCAVRPPWENADMTDSSSSSRWVEAYQRMDGAGKTPA